LQADADVGGRRLDATAHKADAELRTLLRRIAASGVAQPAR
jgi:hypothetical protein